jgi:hypothetical protein
VTVILYLRSQMSFYPYFTCFLSDLVAVWNRSPRNSLSNSDLHENRYSVRNSLLQIVNYIFSKCVHFSFDLDVIRVNRHPRNAIEKFWISWKKGVRESQIYYGLYMKFYLPILSLTSNLCKSQQNRCTQNFFEWLWVLCDMELWNPYFT